MISDRLEKLVEEMVERGVQFEDAVFEFEKRFIARVLGRCDGSLTKSRRYPWHPSQHALPQDGRVQDQEAGRVGGPALTNPAGGCILSSRHGRVLTRLRRIRFKERHVVRKDFYPHTLKTERTSMNVRPLHDRLIVQRLEEGEQRIGGIIIPDSAKEKPQQGKVIAAGAGKVKDDGKRVALDVKAGDLILFGKYSGQEIKLDGEEYLIMREDEVLAIVEGGETKKKK